MQSCDTCGNHYDKCFEISYRSKKYVFDSFECAISKIAPTCSSCQCKVIGHGVEENEKIYCCVHCAKMTGQTTLKDRA